MSKPKYLIELHTIALQRGWVCHAEKYYHDSYPYQWTCDQEHLFTASWRFIRDRNQDCPICTIIPLIMHFVSRRKWTFHYRSDIQSFEWICNRGHNFIKLWKDVKKMKQCPACAQLKSNLKNNPNIHPDDIFRSLFYIPARNYLDQIWKEIATTYKEIVNQIDFILAEQFIDRIERRNYKLCKANSVLITTGTALAFSSGLSVKKIAEICHIPYNALLANIARLKPEFQNHHFSVSHQMKNDYSEKTFLHLTTKNQPRSEVPPKSI